MFCVCPELQASMLFMDPMCPNEAIQMLGFEPFSNYSGYSDDLAFTGSATVNLKVCIARMYLLFFIIYCQWFIC